MTAVDLDATNTSKQHDAILHRQALRTRILNIESSMGFNTILYQGNMTQAKPSLLESGYIHQKATYIDGIQRMY